MNLIITHPGDNPYWDSVLYSHIIYSRLNANSSKHNQKCDDKYLCTIDTFLSKKTFDWKF